ncbi:MAG TPA: aminopeptidase P family protein [Planctomycetaceae bacterium]|nr:aminopeptidase P family protein [Planctomycetaceae bacterium]
MLTEDGCLKRRQNLWKRLPTDVAWVLIGDARHVQYFSNFRLNPVSFSADQKCLLLLTRDGGATLIADNFTRRTSTLDVFADEQIIPWYNHKTSVENRSHALIDGLNQVRGTLEQGQGLLETEGVSAMVAESLGAAAQTSFTKDGSSVTLGTLIRSLRRSKLPDEVELLRRCMQACDAGHEAAFDLVQVGVSELDVYLGIQQAAQQAAGCACVVYGDFRATNAEAPKAGGLPGAYVLQDGDLFIVDYSVIIHGYRSDFTNTIAVGAPTDAQRKQFEVCRAALEAAEATLRAGVAAKDVYQAASDVLVQNGYPAMGHHCGHGLGMEHPESPILVPQSTDTLVAGDVVTIEPGLYVEGVGGMRFEHNYLVSDSGSERLSNHRLGLV